MIKTTIKLREISKDLEKGDIKEAKRKIKNLIKYLERPKNQEVYKEICIDTSNDWHIEKDELAPKCKSMIEQFYDSEFDFDAQP